MQVLFITLLSLNRGSSVTVSNRALIQGFWHNGCSITVVQPAIRAGEDSTYTKNLTENGVKFIFLGENTLEKLATEGEKTTTYEKSRMIQQVCKILEVINPLDNAIRYFRKINLASETLTDRYDLVISTSDPRSTHLFTDRLIKKGLKYGKWIQHWGDPLMNDISRKTIYPRKFMGLLEKRIIKNADKIIYVSPFTLELQRKSFAGFSDKMDFLPLMAGEESDDTEPDYKNPVLGYFGDYMSKYRNIMPLYEAVKAHPEYKLQIIGNSDITLECTDNIQVLPRVSIEKLNEHSKKTLIHVCVCNTYGTQIPGKIYYHSNLNRPILVIVDGTDGHRIKKYLEKFKRYTICDNDPSDIYRAINEIMKEEKKKFAVPEKIRSSYIAKQLMNLTNIQSKKEK